MGNAAVNGAREGRRGAPGLSPSPLAGAGDQLPTAHRRRRRYSWMTVEDHRFLCGLDRAGLGGWADKLERLIRADAKRAARVRIHEVPECELAEGLSIDFIVCDRAARQSFGTGGGRRRRLPGAQHG